MTTDKHLHIVSFDIPYPPTYGGVIDIFYKIVALSRAGVKVHLHCFEYKRERASMLEQLCHVVHYYQREEGVPPSLHFKPYIVNSRRSSALLKDLLHDDYPILFEGIHSCYFLADSRLRNRLKIYRESNIEHHYYYHLFKAEKRIFPKMFYLAESIKLKYFQKILFHADLMLTVSKEDNRYLETCFPEKKVVYLPSFHGSAEVMSLSGKGKYNLYHGQLGVPENSLAAEFLIRKVMEDGMAPLVIAGLNPPESLITLAKSRQDVKVVANPDENEMKALIRDAHIHIMVSFQATGLKLKLLNALFNGRFCLVSPEMVHGTELADLCEIARTPEEFRTRIRELENKDFTEALITKRKERLMSLHSDNENCKILMDLLNL
ncbi:MAG: glycosyltransferase family 1 protein [bacterium]